MEKHSKRKNKNLTKKNEEQKNGTKLFSVFFYTILRTMNKLNEY